MKKKSTKQKILEALEEKIKCPKCDSNDTYESMMAQLLGLKNRCNSCGEYF